jgi:hypothetical protein
LNIARVNPGRPLLPPRHGRSFGIRIEGRF